MRQQGGHRVGGRRHVGITEDDQHPGRTDPDQLDGGFGDDPERAFGADHRLRQVAAVLRQQVLQGIPGDLPREGAELGPDHLQPGLDQRVQARNLLHPIGCVDLPADAVDQRQRRDVVRGATVGDAHAGRRRCCRSCRRASPGSAWTGRDRTAEPSGATCCCRCDMTTPGSTSAVRLLPSTSRILFRCRAKSMTMPVPMALPATDVPPPRLVTGTPVARLTARVASTSSTSSGSTTTSRQQPIIARVGGVLGSPAKPAGYRTADRFCKLGSDVARAIGYRRHADVVSKGDASSWQADGCG